MINFWGQPPPPNPADMFAMWSNAFAPQRMPPVYAQLFDFGNALNSMYESSQAQGAGSFNANSLQEMIRQFSFNPIFSGIHPGTAPTEFNPLMAGFAPAATFPWGQTNVRMPALGIGRETQEDWSELASLQRDYAEAARAYLELYQTFAQRAGQRFQETLAASNDEASFSNLCRKWIDCCETAFQEIAVTDEYSQIFGNMINTAMRLLRHANRMQEKGAAAARQPSRGELDEIYRKNGESTESIKQLQIAVRDLEQRIEKLQKKAPQRRRTQPKSSSGKQQPRSRRS